MPGPNSNSDPNRLSRKELGLAFGVSTRTVDRWVSQGCPRNSDKTFRLADVDDWREISRPVSERDPTSRSTEPDRSPGGSGTSLELKRSAQEAVLRYREARAEREELVVEEMRGNLIQVSESKRRRVALCAMFRQELMALASRLSHLLHGRAPSEIHKIIDSEARRILTSLIEAPATPNPPETDE